MDLNIPGLVGLIVFYASFLLFGVWIARKRCILDKHCTSSDDEQFMLFRRDVGWFVSCCSIIATFIGGVHTTTMAQLVYKKGLASVTAPLGFSVSLFLGGLFFAKKIRKADYVTMIDPLQERYGKFMATILFILALISELLWSASMFGMLYNVTMVMGDSAKYVVMVAALMTVLYTIVGGLYVVGMTDVIQLFFIVVGIWLALPFTMVHDHVATITNRNKEWLGNFKIKNTGQYIDLTLVMILGGLPWQTYFQRVLSTRSPKQAQIVSLVGSFGCLVMAVPGILFGAIVTSTDWKSVMGNSTQLPLLKANNANDVFSFVLKYLTPEWLTFVTIGSISAAVISSADSSLLSASTMVTHNFYKDIKKLASPKELIWVTRVTIFVFGAMATALGLTVNIVHQLWLLSSDFIYVLLFPQLFCAILITPVNIYGSVSAFIVGLALRLCGGEPMFALSAVIEYPFYDSSTERQLFPFRTLAMGCSMLVLVLVSYIANRLSDKYGTNVSMSQDEIDILKISYKEPEMGEFASFSKITRWSGSYNSITASALELRSKEDRLLLRTTLVRNSSACSNRPKDVYDERLEI